MENRLFLLDAPEELVPSGLTANILADVDVTPEAEYSGKITLTQLNAYSGELKAEALTNFKTIKIEKDGSESFTNVAKLLLELQQGGGVEDAREEAIIAIESAKGDAELRNQVQDLGNYVSFLHHTPESYAAELGDVITSVEEHMLSAWAPSVEEADGTRTQFKSRDLIAKEDEEQFLVVLNGVIVTPEDGTNIRSEFGPYVIGFEFNVAPSIGDVIEFHGTRVAGKSSRPYEESITNNTAILDQNSTSMDDFKVIVETKRAEIVGEKDDAMADITQAEAAIKEVEKSRAQAYDSMLVAESIAEVNEHSKEVKSFDAELSSLTGDLIAAKSELQRLEADEKSLNNDEDASKARFAKIEQEGQKANREFTEKVDMFEAIDNELRGADLA